MCLEALLLHKISSLERHIHTLIHTMYKIDKTRISSRQIWHTIIRLYTENIHKSPHYCAITYRGIKNRAAIKGHEQSVAISTLDTSKDVVKYWNQNRCKLVFDWTRLWSAKDTYSCGFYCRKIIQSIQTECTSIKRQSGKGNLYTWSTNWPFLVAV